jgi:pimeloyl-ACP methyl ester carboxylesterase
VSEDDFDITFRMVQTGSLEVCVRERQFHEEGIPVVFVHGNVSSSPFFFPAFDAMSDAWRPLAVDLRGFGGTDTKPVDATRGLADFAGDVRDTLDAMDIGDVHLVGWSMGGGVAMQMVIDDPARFTTVTLINPVSPYGFGGTSGADGRLLSPDAAGSGGGVAAPDFVQGLKDGDYGTETPSSPRNVLRTFYVAPGWDGEHEELFVASMLSTSVGEDNYPGDSAASDHWPGVAAGDRGVLNTMAPTHLDLSGLIDVDPKPPILWIRGGKDQIVSDNSMFDLAALGAIGAVPGWPGPEVAPPQPMLVQIRSVLDAYASNGGRYTEQVFENCGHSPHIEDVPGFVAALEAHLTSG